MSTTTSIWRNCPSLPTPALEARRVADGAGARGRAEGAAGAHAAGRAGPGRVLRTGPAHLGRRASPPPSSSPPAGAFSGYLSSGVAARQERLRRTIGVLEPELQRREDERHRVGGGQRPAGGPGGIRLAGAPAGARARSVQPRGPARDGAVVGSCRAGHGVVEPRCRRTGRGRGPRRRPCVAQPVPRGARGLAAHRQTVVAAGVARQNVGPGQCRRRGTGRGAAGRGCSGGATVAAPRAFRERSGIHRSGARRPALPHSAAPAGGQSRGEPPCGRDQAAGAAGSRPAASGRRPPARRPTGCRPPEPRRAWSNSRSTTRWRSEGAHGRARRGVRAAAPVPRCSRRSSPPGGSGSFSRAWWLTCGPAPTRRPSKNARARCSWPRTRTVRRRRRTWIARSASSKRASPPEDRVAEVAAALAQAGAGQRAGR